MFTEFLFETSGIFREIFTEEEDFLMHVVVLTEFLISFTEFFKIGFFSRCRDDRRQRFKLGS